MECLPEEMVSLIGQLLTVEDLVACCAVSRAWRVAFNRDVIWKNRCHADLAQYLRDTKCVVEPMFVSPEVPDSELSDVCEWRLNYMRQNHLHNNWRHGRYKGFQIPADLVSELICIYKCLFYGRDFAVLCGLTKQGNNQVQLWKITSSPVFLSKYTVPIYPVDLNVTENLVLLTCGDVVEVLSITNSLKLQFKHAFHFTQSEKILVPVLENLFIPKILRERGIGHSSIYLEGPTLIAIIDLPNQNKKMHFWNVETGDKLREEIYEDCTFFYIFKSEGSSKNNRVIVIAEESSLATYKLLIYDFTQFVFHPFSVQSQWCPIDCFLHNEFLACALPTNLKIYNIATKQLVLNKTGGTYYDSKFKLYRNRIIFNCVLTLHLFNPLNSEVQLLFRLPDNGFDIRLNTVLGEKFIIFDEAEPATRISRPFFLEEDKGIKLIRPFPFPPSSFRTYFRFSSCLMHINYLPQVFNFW